MRWELWALLILLVVAAFAAVVLRPRRIKERAMKTFARDLAANPSFGRHISNMLRERSNAIDEARNAPTPTLAEIPDLVKDLVSPDSNTHDAAAIRLEKAGDSASQALLAAISDAPSMWRRATEHISDDAPAERISRLLIKTRPRELGERIGYLWDHQDWRVATLAIKSRAAAGRAELSSWLIALLDRDLEDSVRIDAACEGVDMAINDGWAEPALLADLQKWAEANITAGPAHPSKWAVGFLARLQRDRAIALFQSDHILSLNNNRNIHFILDELESLGIVIPASVVHPILAKSLEATEWPWNYTFGAALTALARTEPAEAIRLAESQIRDSRHGFSALRFLYKAMDLPRSFRTTPPPGFELTDAERRVLMHLDHTTDATGQIGNGGLSQYFFNPEGDNWRRDVASLTAIGFPEGAKALEQAAFIIDPNGASPDRNRRIKQYAALEAAKEQQLDELSKLLYGNVMEAAEYRYILRHADLFRRIKSARLRAGIDSQSDD